MQAFLYQFFHMVSYITFYYLYLGVKKIKRNIMLRGKKIRIPRDRNSKMLHFKICNIIHKN